MDPIPPDPYAALNVPRDASSTAIKSAYRKLALKYHPDKAKDKGDEFHRIQQAYELIGEDEARSKYDDQVRLTDLRKDVYGRRGSYGPTVDVRTAAFDMRSASSPGAAFQTRGPPRYEERRPNVPNMGGSAPRSPFAEDEAFDSYFPSRAGSRKYDGYDASSRRPPSARAATPKSTPRSEEVREASRKEKVSTSRTRNDKKKQRDQEMRGERKGKYEFADVESEASDEDYFGAAQRRASPIERSRKENRADFYEDHRSEKFQTQSSSIRDYIHRAKVEGGPVEKGSPPPPPPFQRSSSAQEPPTFTREAPPSPPRDGQYGVRRGGRESRPAQVRKSASKSKDKSPESPKAPKTSSKETRAKPTGTRSPEPLHTTDERRPPPPLHPANSAPGSIRIPKARTLDELDFKGSPSPRAERSSTSPAIPAQLRRSSTRKGDTTPIAPSNLRHTETTNDSGYSTGNSPNEAFQPSSTKYYYGADAVQVDAGVPEYESVLREPNRMYRRSPSPVNEPSPRERERPSSARERPSVGRSSSFQTSPQPRQNSVDMDRAPTSSSRRPSMVNRTSSNNRGSSSTQQRVPSSPIPTLLRTGSFPGNKDGLFFGEIPREAPIEFRELNYGASGAGVRRVPDDAKVQYASYAPVSYGAYPQGRRGSEDLSRARAEAHAYIDSTRSRGGQGPAPLKRSGTFAY